MATVADVIDRLGLVDSDPQAVFDRLTALNIEKVDTQSWTAKGLNERLGSENSAIVLGSLESIGESLKGATAGTQEYVLGVQVRSSYSLLNSEAGIPIYHDTTRGFIDLVSALGSWPEGLADQLKAIGRWKSSEWIENGGEGELSIEAVTQAIAGLQLEKFAVGFAQKIEGRIRIEAAKPGSTIASIKAAAIAEIG